MSSRDDIMKNRGGRQYNRPPRQDDPPGGEDGYTFTEKQIEAMSGDFYNPPTPVTPVAPSGGGQNGRTGQNGQTAAGSAGQSGQSVQSNQSGLNSRTDASNPDNYTFTQDQLDHKFADLNQQGVNGTAVGAVADGHRNPFMPQTAAERAREQVANAGPVKVQDEYGNEVEAGKAPRVSDGEIIDRFLSDRYGLQPMSKEEREKQERGRKANKLIAAVADGLTAIAKMHYISKGAPYVATTSTLSGTMQKRYDELDAQRKSMDKQYLDAYLQMQRQQREVQRQKELDEYRREQLEASRERQARLEKESQWRMKNGDAKTEQQRKHQENQDAVAKQKAEAATMNAQANQTRANKTGTGGGRSGGGGGRGSSKPAAEEDAGTLLGRIAVEDPEGLKKAVEAVTGSPYGGVTNQNKKQVAAAYRAQQRGKKPTSGGRSGGGRSGSGRSGGGSSKKPASNKPAPKSGGRSGGNFSNFSIHAK